MPKSAILNIEREGLLEKVPFKQYSLLFDHLYVNNFDFKNACWDVEKDKAMSLAEKNIILSEYDYMIQKGILKTYINPRSNLTSFADQSLLNDILQVNQSIEANLIPTENTEVDISQTKGFRFAGVVKLDNQMIFNIEDIRMRVGAAYLGSTNPLMEFVPLVNSFDSYTKASSKDLASHIVLDKIPVPDPTTSWEQLFDFRNDEVIKRKYNALLNWLNEISNADLPLHIVVDKYNQLYSEYLHQYQLHRINSKLTKIEMLISYGTEIISQLLAQGIVPAFKGILNMSQRQVTLLQEEKNIQGRELSYMFEVKEKFGG